VTYAAHTGLVYINGVFYVYSSTGAAQKGAGEGATGFFVGVPPASPELKSKEKFRHLYGVTNIHVLNNVQAPTIRLNTQSGGFDCIETASSDWVRHWFSADVAVYSMGIICNTGFHNWRHAQVLMNAAEVGVHEI
jgi:hypothetical protein